MIAELNEAIHPPRRLFICSFLEAVDGAEFSVLRDAMDISDSSLSKHVSALAAVGYVRVEKTVSRGRVRTWLTLTPTGRKAYRQHLRALRRMLGI